MEPMPYLERVKIQSEVLLPLFKILRRELGETRAASLLREAVDEYARSMGDTVAKNTPGSSLDKIRSLLPAFSADNALTVEGIADTHGELSLNVRGCRYAEYFHAIGEPQFGAMMTCEIDPPLTRAIGDDVSLARSQTIMGGSSYCDFRWKLERSDDSS